MVFTPFRLRELELKNRWIMLAMHTGFATGNALTERDYAFYEERAKGGAVKARTAENRIKRLSFVIIKTTVGIS